MNIAGRCDAFRRVPLIVKDGRGLVWPAKLFRNEDRPLVS